MFCAWSVVPGGAGRKGESSQGERGVSSLKASAAEHLWACHVPSARVHSLLGLCIPAFGPSPFPLEHCLCLDNSGCVF